MRRVGITAFGRTVRPRRSGSGVAPCPAPPPSPTPLEWLRRSATSAPASPATINQIAPRLTSSVRRTLALAVGDIRVQANAIAELAGVSESRDDIAGARQYYAQAIALRTRIGDSRGLASDYNNLAGLAQDAGDFDGARRQLEAALAINRRDGRAEVAATNLVNLAGLASLTGDFGRAVSLYREALATWREREQWADMADALRGLGELELRRGDYPAARNDLREALDIYDRTGPAADAFAVRQEMAGALAAQGELQGAWTSCGRPSIWRTRPASVPAFRRESRWLGPIWRPSSTLVRERSGSTPVRSCCTTARATGQAKPRRRKGGPCCCSNRTNSPGRAPCSIGHSVPSSHREPARRLADPARAR